MRQAALTGSSVARFHQGGAFQPWLKARGPLVQLAPSEPIAPQEVRMEAWRQWPLWRENKRCFTDVARILLSGPKATDPILP